MAIMWSARQTAECAWFVSLNGYDTVSAWNAYLLSQSLPQDCTAANIGSSTYPYRTWAQVVADSRSVSGEKVAVGLGRWGQDAQRSVWIKRMHWMGMTGTVIDMQLCSSYVARTSASPETFEYFSVKNGESYAFLILADGIQSIIFRSCGFDYLGVSSAIISSSIVVYMYNCTVLGANVPLSANYKHMLRATNCLLLFDVSNVFHFSSVLVSTVTSRAAFTTYYCCFTNNSSGGGTQYNIKADPLFNNPSIGDYTLSPASPCLYKGKNGTHIGAMGEALTLTPNSPEMADGTAVYSLTGGITDLVKTSYDVGGVTMYMLSLRTGKMSGTVESGWIDLGRTREVDSLRFVADMIYGAGGNYAQAPSPDLNKLSVSYKAALTEAEKAGVSWVSTEWGAEELAVSARYVKLLITVTSTTPAP
jgi:hypothetical protein